MHKRSVFAMLFLTASLPLLPQVVPAATEGGFPHWSAGAGLSCYDPGLGHGHMYGGALWVGYSLEQLPFLKNFGLEFEARNFSLDRPASTPILREDTAAMGATYSWRRFRNSRPYIRLSGGLGNTDFLGPNKRRLNQLRAVLSFGGGLDYRVFRTVWVRADYEYQDFPNFFSAKNFHPPSGAPMDPQGVTAGVIFNFSNDQPSR